MKVRNLGILYIVLLFTSGIAHCQTVSPTAEEYKGPRAKGFFTVSNNGVRPMSVTVEVANLAISPSGRPVLTPNPTGVSVKLKEPEFKLGPNAVHMVNFDATCSSVPCHFELLATFAPLSRGEGLNVGYQLGTAVYVCDQQKNCRRDTLAAMGLPVGK